MAALTGPLLQQRCIGIELILVVQAGQVEGSHQHLGGEAAVPFRLKDIDSHLHQQQPCDWALECHLLSSSGSQLPLTPLLLPPSILSCNPWIP